MHRILRCSQLRDLEVRHEGASPSLMARAAQAAAAQALRMMGGKKGTILVLAGKGNNGGDALLTALLLRQQGHRVCLLHTQETDTARICLPLNAWLNAGGTVDTEWPHPPHRPDLIIDGLLGIGLSRPPTGHYESWIHAANRSDCPILALDVPSGLDAETGLPPGVAIRADLTLTFLTLKPGLLMNEGPDLCGSILVDPLGVDADDGDGQHNHPALFAQHLKPRRANSHKGSYGQVAVIGGDSGLVGAALLAARAALYAGAGCVHVGLLQPLPVDLHQPELMCRTPQDALERASIIAIGPGLGLSPAAGEWLRVALLTDRPLVVDADALNILASHPVWAASLSNRSAPTLMTPHPGEAARLLQTDTQQIQAHRLDSALKLARQYHAHVLLKGCGTVIASPDGAWRINTTGHPGLATAGSGDVLTGLIASLLAQGWSAFDALSGGAWLHGAAAQSWTTRTGISIGLTSSELCESIRAQYNQQISQIHPLTQPYTLIDDTYPPSTLS
jgi:hydroxyethylthiazole kinase-like uncharacterized protein yjeF